MPFEKYTKPVVKTLSTSVPRLWIREGRFFAGAALMRALGMATKHPSTFDLHIDVERGMIALAKGETYTASLLTHNSHCTLPALRQAVKELLPQPGFGSLLQVPDKLADIPLTPCREIPGALQFDIVEILKAIPELNVPPPKEVSGKSLNGWFYICGQCHTEFTSEIQITPVSGLEFCSATCHGDWEALHKAQVFEAAPDAVVAGLTEQIAPKTEQTPDLIEQNADSIKQIPTPEQKPETPAKKPLGRPKNVTPGPPPVPREPEEALTPEVDPNRCILDHLGELIQPERQRFNVGMRQLWGGRQEEAAETIGVSVGRLMLFRRENSARVDAIMKCSGTSDVGMLLNIWHTDAEKALSARKGA